jgi:hypothetical protein
MECFSRLLLGIVGRVLFESSDCLTISSRCLVESVSSDEILVAILVCSSEVRGSGGYGSIVLGFFCSVWGVAAATFLSCWGVLSPIWELGFIKHTFIGPCILSSGRSVSVIWVKGVFGAVAREGFGETVWGNEVGLGNLFIVMAHQVMVAFCCHHFKKDVKSLLC